MGKNLFGRRMDLMAECKARNLAFIGREPVLEEFSYIIETASDAENMEPLRQLVEKYGKGRLDLEDTLTRIKNELLICVDICHKHLGYDGRKAQITITLNNGCFSVIHIHHFTDIWVVLKFRWKYIYVIGFLNRNGSFQFKNMDYIGWEKLNFTCDYRDLTTKGNCCLNTFSMGIIKLQNALKIISQLTMQNNEEINDWLIASSLLTLVVMFPEAVRILADKSSFHNR